ncbi:hypothetical protein [Bradyrhizobium oligotrophicum]|uniref:hypothetical protein n=1 Tax=Bradyrhizobium oligotrophicum TaxID=44255 RepID=UPI003EC10B52
MAVNVIDRAGLADKAAHFRLLAGGKVMHQPIRQAKQPDTVPNLNVVRHLGKLPTAAHFFWFPVFVRVDASFEGITYDLVAW